MKNIILFLITLFASSIAIAERIELVLWHAMAGHLGDEVRLLADDFNQSQNEFTIKPANIASKTSSLIPRI